jgi:hypothetical protein
VAEILDKDGRIKVIGRVSKKSLDGDQVPGMPGAICHACGLGYRCMNEDCPNDAQNPMWPTQ